MSLSAWSSPEPPEFLRRVFFRCLVATEEGRAFVLSLMIDAEEGDEAGVFDRLVALAGDESMARAVAAHKADEARHAALFRGCLERLGLREVRDFPDSLRVIRVMAESAGGVFALRDASSLRTPEDVMNTYALLLAIEERGVEQFPRIGAEFRRIGDDATARVFEQVARDERGHARSCELLGRRHAPDDAAFRDACMRFRRAERRAFGRVGRDTVAYALKNGLIQRGLLALAMVRLGRSGTRNETGTS